MQSTKLICLFLVVVGATAEPTKDEQFQKVAYGPDNCIQTYPSETGTCIVETKCKEDSLNKLNIGLVCAGKKGDMTRHVFGVDSFGHSEKFDTLIPCTQCLAIDNFDSGKDTEEAVLKDEVETLKGDVKSLGMRVTKLEGGAEKVEEAAEEKKEDKQEEKKEEKAEHLLVSGDSTTASEDEESDEDEDQEEEAKKKVLQKAHLALRGRKRHAVKKAKKHQAKKHRRAQQKKEQDDEDDSEDEDEQQEDEEQKEDDDLDADKI